MAYLGCKIETQVAVLRQLVLDKKRYLVREGQFDTFAQSARLAEVDQILKREGQRNRLGKMYLHVLFRVLDVGRGSKLHGSRADVALAAKFDAVFCALN